MNEIAMDGLVPLLQLAASAGLSQASLAGSSEIRHRISAGDPLTRIPRGLSIPFRSFPE